MLSAEIQNYRIFVIPLGVSSGKLSYERLQSRKKRGRARIDLVKLKVRPEIPVTEI